MFVVLLSLCVRVYEMYAPVTTMYPSCPLYRYVNVFVCNKTNKDIIKINNEKSIPILKIMFTFCNKPYLFRHMQNDIKLPACELKLRTKVIDRIIYVKYRLTK